MKIKPKQTKRKRVSKKLKSSWRKHTKVDDVLNFIDQQRDEENFEAPLRDLSNEELFVIDTTGPTISSSRIDRKALAEKPLKCFSALTSYTKVPDPLKKRNRIKSAVEKKSKFALQKEAEAIKNGKVTKRNMNILNQHRLKEIIKESKQIRGKFTKDLWNDGKSSENDLWIDKNTLKHTLKNTGKPIKRTTNDLHKKKSSIPSIEIPHPGMSYNPSNEDHQDLLQTVAKKEMEIIKQEKHIERVTQGMFRKVTEDSKLTEKLNELSEGLVTIKQEDEIKSETECNTDQISLNPPVKNKKKTLKQRRKQREQLELQKQRKTKLMEKRKASDLHKLKHIQLSLEKTEQKQKKLRELRKTKKEKKRNEPKLLSSHKYEDPGLEFQMKKDIAGNLKDIKKEGNLLSDRFKSLQKRNILEPSKRAHRKKPKVKVYVKPGHKDNWEETISRKEINIPSTD